MNYEKGSIMTNKEKSLMSLVIECKKQCDTILTILFRNNFENDGKKELRIQKYRKDVICSRIYLNGLAKQTKVIKTN